MSKQKNDTRFSTGLVGINKLFYVSLTDAAKNLTFAGCATAAKLLDAALSATREANTRAEENII